ncbi:hypothetical protein [Thermovibrio sp.]
MEGYQMIGVDYGTKEIKWFDGKRFGKGLPERKGLTVGLTCAETLVKEAVFPLCKGRQLDKLVLNEVIADLSVEPSLISVAYCPVERLEKGCRLLIFVEKRELIDSLPRRLRESSVITLDLIGTAAAVKLLYPKGKLKVVDAGEGKLSLLSFEEGELKGVELFKGGFNKAEAWEELTARLERGQELLLIGGGALKKEVRELLKDFTVKVPSLEPFGDETPLYFNAYGLYHFKKSSCKALFSRPSLFSSELLEKNRTILVRAGAIVIASLILITAGEVIKLKAAKRDYYNLKREVVRELSELTGEKVLLPEVQIPQKVEGLKELKEFLKVDQPSVLIYLKAISESVVEGIKVLEVSGSASSGQFVVVGKSSSEESLKRFTENLRRRFERVSISLADGKKFKITLWRVKVGT